MASCVTLLAWEAMPAENVVAEILGFKRELICKKLGIPSHTAVPTLVVLNWTCPCLIPSAVQTEQTKVIQRCLSESIESAAVVLMHAFIYNCNTVYLEEKRALDPLANIGHMFDIFSSTYRLMILLTSGSSARCATQAA